MQIRKDDLVEVIRGEEKGKRGKVLHIIHDKDAPCVRVLLDGINMDGTSGTDVGDVTDVGTTGFPTPAEDVEAPVIVEALDRNIGAFQGLALAAGVLALLVGGIMLAGMVGLVPDYLRWLHTNTTGVTIGLVVLTGVAAGAGWYVGKAAVEQKLAMRRAGGRM